MKKLPALVGAMCIAACNLPAEPEEVLGVAELEGGTCDAQYVGFSHDSFGFTGKVGHGTTHDCHVMKVYAEGNLANGGYQGMRTSSTPIYGDVCPHDVALRVHHEPAPGVAPVRNAVEGEDYRLGWRVKPGSVQFPPLGAGVAAIPCLPHPTTGAIECGFGHVVLDLHDTDPWEPPELIRIRLTSAEDAVGTDFPITSENYNGGWAIQDSCECRSMFEYPPLDHNNAGAPQEAGDFVQLFGKKINGGTAGQIITHTAAPCAASEIVQEGNDAHLFVGFFDGNRVNKKRNLGANLQQVPNGKTLVVRFKLLSRRHWKEPAACAADPEFYDHYVDASEIELRSGNNPLPYDPASDSWTITVASGKKFRKITLRAIDDRTPENLEIAHFTVDAAALVGGGASTYIDPGWSSDFRWVIQDTDDCAD